VTPGAFRTLALSLPEATEQAHMRHPDFRVRGKIFATMGYPDAAKAMVKLTNMQQDTLVHAFPKMFAPVPGKWGEKGATHVTLRHATRAPVLDALRMAWRAVAPKELEL
jgi:hypothetical protein